MRGKRKGVRWVLPIAFLLLCPGVDAQTNALPSATSSHPAESQDKSGTNPLVLRYTVQVFNEYYNLPGDGLWNSITKFRFVVPFAKKRASIKKIW